MIKYTVYCDRKELGYPTKRPEKWSSAEIIDAYNRESWLDPEILFSSENKSDAEKFFEEEKPRCRSFLSKTVVGYVVVADILYLAEEEFDDEDEFLSADWIDIFAEPITVDED